MYLTRAGAMPMPAASWHMKGTQLSSLVVPHVFSTTRSAGRATQWQGSRGGQHLSRARQAGDSAGGLQASMATSAAAAAARSCRGLGSSLCSKSRRGAPLQRGKLLAATASGLLLKPVSCHKLTARHAMGDSPGAQARTRTWVDKERGLG